MAHELMTFVKDELTRTATPRAPVLSFPRGPDFPLARVRPTGAPLP